MSVCSSCRSTSIGKLCNVAKCAETHQHESICTRCGVVQHSYHLVEEREASDRVGRSVGKYAELEGTVTSAPIVASDTATALQKRKAANLEKARKKLMKQAQGWCRTLNVPAQAEVMVCGFLTQGTGRHTQGDFQHDSHTLQECLGSGHLHSRHVSPLVTQTYVSWSLFVYSRRRHVSSA